MITRRGALATVLLALAAPVLGAQGIAVVKFRLEGLSVTGQPNEPEHPSRTVQRTQFLTFSLAGGTPPWSVIPNNNVVRVEQSANNMFKIVPNSLGTSTVAVVDSRGGGKYVDVVVIEDRYGADATIFRNDNGASITAGAVVPTTFTLNVGYRVTAIRTYHYNQGKGRPAGTLTLRHADGRQYGPWPTTVESQFYWVARPNASVPPGTYTLVDSEPGSWSSNAASHNAGFAIVNGMPRLPN